MKAIGEFDAQRNFNRSPVKYPWPIGVFKMGLGHVSRPGIGGRGSRLFIFLGTFVTRCFMAIGPPIWITDDFEALVFGMSIHATFFTFERLLYELWRKRLRLGIRLMIYLFNSATNSLYPCVYLATHQPHSNLLVLRLNSHLFSIMAHMNMDTGATSHLADNTSILTSFSNLSIYPSVFIGNGHSIPVTHTGHSLLHISSKPRHLNHILVTPHIIKNTISVRQFTRDNDVSVEFDAYGFLVKDYHTGQILLRCDSTGDLYPVTQQPSSQTPVVLLSFSSTTWHRRLGHPGDDVLSRLESRNLISCHKPKLPALCYACQLGKHAKLSFYNSKSSVDSEFEIIHSDI
nr:ribonuclease H-like domain-containing protein [Tanacetum cinerariifolium]